MHLGICEMGLFCLTAHINATAEYVDIASGNGLSPVRRQTITWTNAKLLSISTFETNFSKIEL